MSVSWVVNSGEKFADYSCANKWKWEWVSVEVEENVCEEMKKKCINTWFHNVSYLCFHENDFRYIDFELDTLIRHVLD